jgi:hypothetical protein
MTLSIRGADTDPTSNLPDGTEHVVTLLEFNGPSIDLDEIDEDDPTAPSEAREVPCVRRDDIVVGIYTPGDEIPLELAGRIWGTAQSQQFACFDGDGQRLDEPHPRERGFESKAQRAIDTFRRRRFGATPDE